ncbi:MAG: TlpA family protein disulfide reductase [Dysgonamonadaceae bacterium]|jgi:peroxiredoxin|nr:TlpA family protein disulfide reductase [Dysgonamonadaceae bacterium]
MKKLVYLLLVLLVTGTACNTNKKADPETAYQSCTDAEKVYNDFVNQYDQLEKEGNLTPALKDSLEKEAEILFEDAKKVYASFFENYINTAFAQQVFTETKWVRRLNQTQLESVVNSIEDTVFKETEACKNAINRLAAMKNSQVGHVFTDIVSKNPEDNAIKLSDYAGKGKYVILDFWASWCPDCRKEMPALVDLYATFKDKNVEIVGYSLDRDKNNWIEGIKELNITWPQMSDCDFWNSQGAKSYAVQYIPLTILIDPEGNIIERALSLEELYKKIAELTK